MTTLTAERPTLQGTDPRSLSVAECTFLRLQRRTPSTEATVTRHGASAAVSRPAPPATPLAPTPAHAADRPRDAPPVRRTDRACPDRTVEADTEPLRVRLVPCLAPAPRPTPTGTVSVRPPAIEDRILARRRESLAAERAARSDQASRGPVPSVDPTSTCCSLALAAIEALAGTRPVAQLARWLAPSVYDALAARSALSVRVLGTPGSARRPEVRRVRVFRLGEHIAEATVIVDDGRRVRALAVRLESWRGSWRAAALEIG